MARPRHLTRQLILTLTIGTVILWAAAASVTTLLIGAELDEAFDSALRQTAQRLLPLAADGLGDHDGDEEGHEIPRFGAEKEELLAYQVRNADGAVLIRSLDAPVAGFEAPLSRGFTNVGGMRIFTEGLPSDRIFIQVAEPLSHRRDSLMQSMAALFLPLGAVIPLAVLGIWLAVSRGLAPVGELQREIADRGATNLRPLKAMDLPVELAPIASSVGRLIERLRLAFDAERAFASNAAHELRTPIAGSLAQTQLLLAELKGTPAEARARNIEASLKRLGDLAEKLLQLSRAEAGIAATEQPVDLLPVVDLLVEDCSRRADTAGRLHFEIEPGANLCRPMDRDAFAIALRNLLDNALLHGTKSEPVVVSIDADGSVHVRNGGPAIGPETLAALKNPFVRGRTTAHGSGLGLAIVETIMSQTGGRLELNSPATGRSDGFEAILRFAEAGPHVRQAFHLAPEQET
ncbi:MAG: ATP-binding protein [Devosia sp.]|nr:ATP-binding protein [Devosia sp.]